MKNNLYAYIKHAYYHKKPWHFEPKDPKALTMDQTRNQLFPLMVKSPRNLRHQRSKDLSTRSMHNFGHVAIQVYGLDAQPPWTCYNACQNDARRTHQTLRRWHCRPQTAVFCWELRKQPKWDSVTPRLQDSNLRIKQPFYSWQNCQQDGGKSGLNALQKPFWKNLWLL